MAITSIATLGSGSINVYFGTASPPTLTDNKTGEEYYVTSDGTIQGTIQERWVYSGTSWFKTDQAAAPETVTSLSFAGSTLTYVDENGSSTAIDISSIDTDTSVVSASYDPATSIMTFTKSNGSTFTADLATINEGVAAITLDMTGFPNRTDSELLYNEATSVLTLRPKAPATEFTMYYRGEAIVVSSALTITCTNTGGGRYIVYNTATSQLEEFFPSYEGLIKGELLVSYVYLDGTNTTPVIFGDERHSSDRDTQWHLSKHLEQGAVWRDGGILAYTLNDDTATALAFTTPIEVADEDVVHSITHSATPTIGTYQQILEGAAELPVLYYLGADFTQMSPTTGPFVGTGQVPKYNLISAGSGSLADAPNNAYINYWVIYTNDARYPVKLMLGQNAYSNLNDAEAENFSGYDLPLPEIVVAYKIITQQSSTHTGNDAGLVIVQVNMVSGPSSTMSQFFTTDSHANLTGRNLSDQHSIASITGLQTVLNTKLETVALSDLTDVDTTGIADTSILQYNSANSQWEISLLPTDIDTLANLSDTTLGAPASGEALIYNGSAWVNQALPSGVTTLAALDDTNVPAPTDGQALVWDSATSKWISVNRTLADLVDTDVSLNEDNAVLYWDISASQWKPGHVPYVEPLQPPIVADKLFYNLDVVTTGPLAPFSQQGAVRDIGYGWSAASVFGGDIYVSKNGHDWYNINTVGGIPAAQNDFVATTTHLYAFDSNGTSGSSSPLYRTSDGQNWTQVSIPNGYYYRSLSGVGPFLVHHWNPNSYSLDGENWTATGFGSFSTNTSNKMATLNDNGTVALIMHQTTSTPYQSVIRRYNLTSTTVTEVGAVYTHTNTNMVRDVEYINGAWYYFTIGNVDDVNVYKSLDDGNSWNLVTTIIHHYVFKSMIIGTDILLYGNGNDIVKFDTITETATIHESGYFTEAIIYDTVDDRYLINTNENNWEIYQADYISSGSGTYKEYVVDDLLNVNATSKVDGDMLVWDHANNEWVPQAPVTTLAALDDTTISSPVDKSALIWDNTTSKFITSSFAIGKPVFCNVRERWDDVAGTSVACEDEMIFNLDMVALGNQNISIDLTGTGLAPYQATSVTFICDNTSTTGFVVTGLDTIDGSVSVTNYWQGGSAPTAGTAGGFDIVTFSIMMMPDNTYKAFANVVSYS